MEDLDRAQRILEGRCPDCGHLLPKHSLQCLLDQEDRLKSLKARAAISKLRDKIKETGNV